MKKIIIPFIILFLILSFAKYQKRTFIERFSLGNFSYDIYKEEKYSHDDDIYAEYFVVYQSKQKKVVCSAFMSEKRNDTIFTKGKYSHINKKLIFMEYYYYHQNARILDSVKTTFFPSKNGKLVLLTVIEFKNGISKKVR
jgi:hypothetical protein